MNNNELPQEISATPLTPNLAHLCLWSFIFYILPIVLIAVIVSLIQSAVHNGCASLPQESQGECGLGWLQLIFIPASAIGLLIGWTVLFIGIIHFSKKLSSTRKSSEKKLVIITGILAGLFVSIGGFAVSWSLIF